MFRVVLVILACCVSVFSASGASARNAPAPHPLPLSSLASEDPLAGLGLAPAQPAQAALRILYTANAQGQLYPCPT